MSFDLYFLERRAGRSWGDAMDALEEAAGDEQVFGDEDDAMWQRIVDGVGAVLPDLEPFVGEAHRELRELSHEATGIQVSMSPGEVALTVPYWYGGAEAHRITATLQEVARAVEEATGLVAFDPQSEQPFLDRGAEAAPATFQHIDSWLAANAEQPHSPRLPWRNRLFGRRSREP